MSRPLQESRTSRQKQFIDVAARLFSRRGYHSVGINEISAELGLSGPAIYRHYPSKEALLVAVLDDVITSHLEEVRDIVSSYIEPLDALDAIIDHHIAFVFDQTENIITWRTEFRSLPDADRRRQRYLQRLYTEEWVRTVRRLRPELDEDQVRLMCDAAISLIQTPTEFHSPLQRQEMAAVLAAMARNALIGTDIPAASPSTVANGAARKPVRLVPRTDFGESGEGPEPVAAAVGVPAPASTPARAKRLDGGPARPRRSSKA